MKKCPYCAEEIQDAAIKCKHCFEFLDESRRPVPPMLPGTPTASLPWYFKTSFILLTFFTMPPLVLPSVWFHPKMHWAWKLVITAAVVGFCWLFLIAVQGLIHQLDEATKMINEMKI